VVLCLFLTPRETHISQTNLARQSDVSSINHNAQVKNCEAKLKITASDDSITTSPAFYYDLLFAVCTGLLVLLSLA